MNSSMFPTRKKWNFDPHHNALNPATALPTYPAYIPRIMSRSTTPSPTPSQVPMKSSQSLRIDSRSSVGSTTINTHTQVQEPSIVLASTPGAKRGTRPPPLQNIPSHSKSCSYTMQVYLSKPKDTSVHIISPPPASMTSHSVLAEQSNTRPSYSSYQSHCASSSMSHATKSGYGRKQNLDLGLGITRANIPPPPPGPPPSKSEDCNPSPKQVPSISVPTVPKIKVPRKYSPPQIMIQESTPTEQQPETGNNDPLG